MKKLILVIVALLIIVGAAGIGGWFFFVKKSSEGGPCQSDAKCEIGLKCVVNVCSSGNKDSKCISKSDCKTSFCVYERCTEGAINEACATYKDCQTGLLCKSKICTEKPTYTKYFDKIDISKMKPGMPPGPNNIPIPSTEFKKTDAIEIDITNSKGTSGEFYTEIIDPISGEKVFTTDKQQISDSRGTGFSLPMNTAAGDYELDVYFNNELIYTVAIKITG